MWLNTVLERSQTLHRRIGTRWMQVGAILVHLVMGAIVGMAASLLAGTRLSPIATVGGTAFIQICLAYAWHRWFGPQINAASISMLERARQRRLPADAHVQIPVPDAWIAPLATTVSLAITLDPSGTTTATIILVGATTAATEMLVKADTIDRIRTGQAYWEREVAKLTPGTGHLPKRRNKMAHNRRRGNEEGGQVNWLSSVVTIGVATILIAGLAALSMVLTNLATRTATNSSDGTLAAIPQPLLLILLTAPPALLLLLSVALIVFAVAVIICDYRKSRNNESNR